MNKKINCIIALFITFILFSGCGMTLRTNAKSKNILKKALSPTATDEDLKSLTESEIRVDKDYIDGNSIEKIKITSIMTDDYARPVQFSEKEYNADEIATTEGKIVYDFKYFGKHEVTVNYYKNGRVARAELIDVVLTSDEYNIGLLLSTVPPTYFTLLMTGECEKLEFNNKLPTIMAFNRPKSYDWDNLYPNMYPNPFSDIKKISTNDSGISWFSYWDQYLIPEMQSYVGYLYKLNPYSKFNFYFCDYTPRYFLRLAYENNIPEDQFTVTFFSDGTGSYKWFTDIFGYNENPASPSMLRYEEYKRVWKNAKNKAQNGDTSYLDDIRNVYKGDGNKSEYGLDTAIITDSALSVKWVVNRKSSDTFGNSDFATSILLDSGKGRNLIAINMYSDIAKQITDETKLEKLKKLYKLNLDDIDKADEEGKKVMIFIGNRGDVGNMRDYALFMINYTKKMWNPSEDYAFFYKGHPGETYNEERNSVNEDILKFGVKTLDSSIPAEMFLLFRPDVEMCGTNSSTFQSYTHEVIPFMIDGKSDSITANVQTFIYSTKRDDSGYNLTITSSEGEKKYVWYPSSPEEFKME